MLLCYLFVNLLLPVPVHKSSFYLSGLHKCRNALRANLYTTRQVALKRSKVESEDEACDDGICTTDACSGGEAGAEPAKGGGSSENYSTKSAGGCSPFALGHAHRELNYLASFTPTGKLLPVSSAPGPPPTPDPKTANRGDFRTAGGGGSRENTPSPRGAPPRAPPATWPHASTRRSRPPLRPGPPRLPSLPGAQNSSATPHSLPTHQVPPR